MQNLEGGVTDPGGIQIELLHVAGCPNVDAARELLRACLAELDLAVNVIAVEGNFPSPTIRVNGRDIMGAAPDYTHAFCRLDVPTRERLVAALEVSG